AGGGLDLSRQLLHRVHDLLSLDTEQVAELPDRLLYMDWDESLLVALAPCSPAAVDALLDVGACHGGLSRLHRLGYDLGAEGGELVRDLLTLTPDAFHLSVSDSHH